MSLSKTILNFEEKKMQIGINHDTLIYLSIIHDVVLIKCENRVIPNFWRL